MDTEENSGVVGWNKAEGRSHGIAQDAGIREGRRMGTIKEAPDVNEPDNGAGGGLR